jgi:hypothetical protein
MNRTLPLLALLLSACSHPALVLPDDTPRDLAALAETVFDDFVTAFPAQRDCIGRVEIRGAWELSDRARYQPDGKVIEVRIPATAPQLSTSLLHELGHHLEQACPDQLKARPQFLEALGLPADAPWPDPGAYESNPSELWAEAVVRHVTGTPDGRRPLRVTATAVEVMALWAQGELTHVPATP